MNSTLILNEIKNYLNIKTDKEFASFLGVKPTTLSMWHKRNTFDIELVFKKCGFINAEWLLTGKGEMLKSDTTETNTPLSSIVREPGPEYGADPSKLNTLLQNKDKEIERLMSIIELMIKENNAGQEVAEKRKTG